MYRNLNTTIISKLDLEKLLSVFVDFLSMFAWCCFESSSICCWYFLGLTIKMVFFPYYRECSPAGSPLADSSDVCSILWWSFIYRLSMFVWFSVNVWSRVFTSPLCACGFVHPQAVPLIVSSHLLKVPLIVSWLNIVIYNWACTVI